MKKVKKRVVSLCKKSSRPTKASRHLSGSLLGLCDSLLDFETSLLLEDHDLEAVKVVEGPSLVGGIDSLGESGCSPLSLDVLLLPDLGDDTGTGSTGQLGDDDAGEADVCEGERLAGDVGRVDQDLVGRDWF